MILTSGRLDRLTLLVPHLPYDVQEVWSAGISQNNDRNGIDSINETGLPDHMGNNLNFTLLRCQRRSATYSNTDGQCNDGGQDTCQTDPTDPRDFVKGLNGGESEVEDGADYYECYGAGCIFGNGVEGDRE